MRTDSYPYIVLRDLLKKHSVRIAAEGQKFKLASGRESDVYIDVKKTALKGEAHMALAYALYDTLSSGDFGTVDAVAGVVLGGCHLASSLGLYAWQYGRTKLDVLHVRKEAKGHGTKNLVEGPEHEPGYRVVVLEDVVTTGGSSLFAVEQLKLANCSVVGILAIVDRRVEERTDHLGDIPFRSIFAIEDLTDVPGLVY